MWKYSINKSISGSKSVLFANVLQRNTPKAIVCVAQRLASSTLSNKQNDENNNTYYSKRRYVDVDTPFAKANKYTYFMPEDPYQASKRITRILEIGTVEDVVDYLLALPIYLQSTVLWNQLIGHCAQYGRANYAEKFYSQMRKRGMKPNESTFTLMLQAYSQSTSPQASKHAEAWIKRMEDFNIEPSIIHINNLLSVYNSTNQPQKTIAKLKELTHSKDDLLPDVFTYTIAFKSCPQLENMNKAKIVGEIWSDIKYRLDKQSIISGDQMSSLAQKAAEIKWTESAIRTTTTNQPDLKIDDQMMIALLSAVTRTAACESDIITAIEAIDRVYSLCPKRAAELLKKNHIERMPGYGMRPSTKVLDAILRFSGGLHEYQLGKEYYDLARQQYPRLESDAILERGVEWIEKQIKRQNNLNAKKRSNERPKRALKTSLAI
ncbi:hypothetical protein K501DRAFT_260236 [Backusella circina FSU 941]|nr:hypothetical protein K501DRAFT_260236 [Backusella circina FSU 941]